MNTCFCSLSHGRQCNSKHHSMFSALWNKINKYDGGWSAGWLCIFFSLPKVSGSRIKSGVSLLDRFWVGDAVRARFNLVGGGFHRVLQRPICCGKDYSDRSTHKTRLGAADHAWLGSSKIAVATVRRVAAMLAASSEGNHGIHRQCAWDSLCFFLLLFFWHTLVWLMILFGRGQLSHIWKSRRWQSEEMLPLTEPQSHVFL